MTDEPNLQDLTAAAMGRFWAEIVDGDELITMSNTVEHNGVSVNISFNIRLSPDMTWEFCDASGSPIELPKPSAPVGATYVLTGHAKASVTDANGNPK